LLSHFLIFFFFFFQAEDGIRDRNVTGVQTCALPIFQKTLVYSRHTGKIAYPSLFNAARYRRRRIFRKQNSLVSVRQNKMEHHSRSEERRVGKEGRPRCAR